MACWKTSQLILIQTGLGPSSGYIGIAIIVNHPTTLADNSANLTQAVAYLDSELTLKYPV